MSDRDSKPRDRKQGPAVPYGYWIRPGVLMAGNYPKGSHQQIQQRVRLLLDYNLTFYIDLTEQGEKRLPAYQPHLEAEAARLGLAAEYRRLPVPDFNTPSATEMKHILDTVDSAIAAGYGVYVHCYFGIGRTGTVIGCYLVRHGLQGSEALEEIVRLQSGTDYEGMTSPVTREQRQMVLGWPIGS